MLHAVARDVGVLFILDVVIHVDGNVRIFVTFNDAPIFVQIRNYFSKIFDFGIIRESILKNVSRSIFSSRSM